MTPSSNPPSTAPGIDPSPPIIIAISPFSVAHMPNIGVTCWSTASTRNPAAPPIAEAMTKASSSERSNVDADEMRRGRIVDDCAQAEPETGAVQRDMHRRGERQRADEQDQVIDPQHDLRQSRSGIAVESGGNG